MAHENRTLQVVGENTMHCAGCESAARFALGQLQGVRAVKADFKTQQIEVEFDVQALSLAEIEQELDWIGYQVEEV